ncbi:MAG: Phosphoribosyl-AMP cyclohydrolase [ANME-2 cluster archaeon]|nr:Phosphoribosyl-AMP cyclohydrolase [ANME-2 cluster archaeon]
MKLSDDIRAQLKFDDKGLITAIAQDHKTNEILMLAFMNLEALEKTVETGKAHYFSRSRGKLWLKGESSGHVQLVHDMYIDCDADAVLMKVEQLGGGACHMGYRSCFYRTLEGDVVSEKVFNPEDVY